MGGVVGLEGSASPGVYLLGGGGDEGTSFIISLSGPRQLGLPGGQTTDGECASLGLRSPLCSPEGPGRLENQNWL